MRTPQSLRRRARRGVARALLALARTPPGGRLAAFACSHLAGLLPIERLAETPRALAFGHPAPQAPGHAVVVPKRYIPHVCAMTPDVLRDIVEAARLAADALGAGDWVVTVNAGRRQDVAQLHAHLLPTSAAHFLLEQAEWRRTLDLRDGAAADGVLRAASIRLEGCRREVRGSLVLRGFEGDRPDLLVSIARGTQTR